MSSAFLGFAEQKAEDPVGVVGDPQVHEQKELEFLRHETFTDFENHLRKVRQSIPWFGKNSDTAHAMIRREYLKDYADSLIILFDNTQWLTDDHLWGVMLQWQRKYQLPSCRWMCIGPLNATKLFRVYSTYSTQDLAKRSLRQPQEFTMGDNEEQFKLVRKLFFSRIRRFNRQWQTLQNPFPHQLNKIPYFFNLEDNHWILVVLDLNAQKTVLYDSTLPAKIQSRAVRQRPLIESEKYKKFFVFAVDLLATLNSLYEQLKDEDALRGKQYSPFDVSNWEHEVDISFPFQKDTSNCGVFALLSLACVIWNTTPSEMNLVQRKNQRFWDERLAWKFRLFLAERSLQFGAEQLGWGRNLLFPKRPSQIILIEDDEPDDSKKKVKKEVIELVSSDDDDVLPIEPFVSKSKRTSKIMHAFNKNNNKETKKKRNNQNKETAKKETAKKVNSKKSKLQKRNSKKIKQQKRNSKKKKK